MTAIGEQIRQARPAEYYDGVMRRYKEGHRRGLVKKAASLARGHTIIELGCGTGMVTEELHRANPDARIIAYDFAPYCVERTARRVPNAYVLNRDICQMDAMEPTRADSIVAIEILEHIEQDIEVVEMAMAAAPLMIASVPNKTAIPDKAGQHVRIYDRSVIEKRYGRDAKVSFHKHQRADVWILFTLEKA